MALGDDSRDAAEQGGGAGGEDRTGVAAVNIGTALHAALHISGTVRQSISIHWWRFVLNNRLEISNLKVNLGGKIKSLNQKFVLNRACVTAVGSIKSMAGIENLYQILAF